MDIRDAVKETLRRLKEIKTVLSKYETMEIPLLEKKALEAADVISDIAGRFGPQVCVLGLLRIDWSEKQIANEMTKRKIPTGYTSINRYKRAAKQTANPKRANTLRRIYEDKVASQY